MGYVLDNSNTWRTNSCSQMKSIIYPLLLQPLLRSSFWHTDVCNDLTENEDFTCSVDLWWLCGSLLCYPGDDYVWWKKEKKSSALQSRDGMDSTPYPGISKSNKSPLCTGQDMKSIYNSNHRTCASPTRVCVHVCVWERETASMYM